MCVVRRTPPFIRSVVEDGVVYTWGRGDDGRLGGLCDINVSKGDFPANFAVASLKVTGIRDGNTSLNLSVRLVAQSSVTSPVAATIPPRLPVRTSHFRSS